MDIAKVYISGKISDLDTTEAIRNFKHSESIITSIGMNPVNPMKNGLPVEAEWHEHMGIDIKMLLECDAILMQPNWNESKGARIEKCIAKEFNMIIFYEEEIDYNNCMVERVKDAIEEVIGYKYAEYSVNCRKREVFYSRLLFTYHCSKLGIENKELSKMVNKPDGTVRRYLRMFSDEIQYNKEFRLLSEKISEKLLITVSQ
jgi:hypothetical protein